MKIKPNIFGKKIGKGKTRTVYFHKENPNWVIKKILSKENPTPEANQNEWNLWLAVKDTPFVNLFCPCVELTPEGHLIMLRCEPVEKNFKEISKILDVELPKDSANPINYGLLNKRSVLIDYGHPDFLPLIDALNQYKRYLNA